MVRILVADDHAIIREGLKRILADQDDMAVAGEAESGSEALRQLTEKDFDLILLDISMPGRSGLEVLKEIRKSFPRLPVLILSMHSEEQYAVRMLRDGASGYLTKSSAPNELISAIRKVAHGGKYITLAVAEKLAFEMDAHIDKPRHKKLSNREYQVMLMLAAGKFVSEVAEELRLSAKTICTYRARIMEKMAMRKNAELTFYAVKNDLLA